ncbi:class I SAM-dependent methyltransferase [Leptospira sp. 96542]|nr:class I SAM-dependent methyltransferase [Leptospira sp. 96542]
MIQFQFKPHKVYPEFYDKCSRTGVLRYKKAELREYGETYFMEEYESQYKKTYYEDEAPLRQMAKRRLGEICKLGIHPQNSKLLEIGSAAGFFLDEAKQMGFVTQGFELSEREVEYSRTKFGLNVEKKSVLDIPVSEYQNSFQVISAYFVVEHIQDIVGIWERLCKWLTPGGVLSLAVPSSFGPSFQTNPDHWFETHPSDHFFDYDIHSLKKLLSMLGFGLKYGRPMSYHPKRDLGLRGNFPKWLYQSYANSFCYGDTIEVAAKKYNL